MTNSALKIISIAKLKTKITYRAKNTYSKIPYLLPVLFIDFGGRMNYSLMPQNVLFKKDISQIKTNY